MSLIICVIESKILHKHSSSTIGSILNLQLTPPNESNKALKPQPWSSHYLQFEGSQIETTIFEVVMSVYDQMQHWIWYPT
jgi:hypothetical protein